LFHNGKPHFSLVLKGFNDVVLHLGLLGFLFCPLSYILKRMEFLKIGGIWGGACTHFWFSRMSWSVV
jgi:hypothetical protein